MRKFTFVKQKGDSNSRWAFATISEVSNAGVTLQKWETSDHPDFSPWQSSREIAFDQFIPEDQQFIKDWIAQRSSAAAPNATNVGATGVACFLPSYSYRVDTSGVLKGKTIMAITAGPQHYLALCTDGTLVAWGQNVYGQLGNGRHGVDALSLEPVLVDTTGALKGKTVSAIGAYWNGSYAVCSDGTLYIWGLPPLNFLLGKPGATASQDKPALFDPVELQGKKVTAISANSGATSFSVLCSDGTLFDWEGIKGSKGATKVVRMDNQGDLKGKKVILIGGGNKALCADGTLVHWNPILVRHLSSVELKVDPVGVPDPAGLLKGKASVAFFDGNRVLRSDGTVVEWRDPTDPPAPELQPLNLTVPAGQTVTALAGDLCLYSNQTLVLLPASGQDEARYRQEAAFVGALQNQTIVAIGPNMVLFEEPVAPGAAPKQ